MVWRGTNRGRDSGTPRVQIAPELKRLQKPHDTGGQKMTLIQIRAYRGRRH